MKGDDLDLLNRYARHASEEAFATLVNRHLNLIYSAALRQVRSPQLAEEVAQSVFTDLARKASKLKPDTILTAWLYQVTRRTAIDVVRREARRQLREQTATEMNAMNATADEWTYVEPLLDDAMSALDETDRTAVLLRYFENKSLSEVGRQLGVSEDAAQKRVSRAVERLRHLFAKRGVTVGAGGLAAIVSANAVQAAPAGLALTISTAGALTGTTIASAATATATKAIAMTTLQKTLVTATVVALAGTGIYEARQASQLRNEVQSLHERQAPWVEAIQQLQRERADLTNQLASLSAEKARARLNSNQAELLRLRGEVGVLKQAANELSRLRQENLRLRQQLPQLTPEDEYKLNQGHAVEAMGDLLTAWKSFSNSHQGDYPRSIDELGNATGLGATNLSGNLTLDDFVLLSPRPDFDEKELIFRNRIPFKNPDGHSLWVYGAVDSNGVPATITMGARYGN